MYMLNYRSINRHQTKVRGFMRQLAKTIGFNAMICMILCLLFTGCIASQNESNTSSLTSIEITADYSTYPSDVWEISQPPLLYAGVNREELCDCINTSQNDQVVTYTFQIPSNSQNFSFYPAVLRDLKETAPQSMPVQVGASTAECQIANIHIESSSDSSATISSPGCTVAITLESKNGTFPERLILESGGKHYSGQASIIFSNVDDGLLLDKFSFSYDLDCYETEASTLLNDSVVNYNKVQSYQYATNASYSMPENYHMSIINAKVYTEE